MEDTRVPPGKNNRTEWHWIYLIIKYSYRDSDLKYRDGRNQ